MKGIECDKKGLKIVMEEKDRYGELFVNNNFGIVYFCFVDFEEVKKNYEEYLMIV